MSIVENCHKVLMEGAFIMNSYIFPGKCWKICGIFKCQKKLEREKSFCDRKSVLCLFGKTLHSYTFF